MAIQPGPALQVTQNPDIKKDFEKQPRNYYSREALKKAFERPDGSMEPGYDDAGAFVDLYAVRGAPAPPCWQVAWSEWLCLYHRCAERPVRSPAKLAPQQQPAELQHQGPPTRPAPRTPPAAAARLPGLGQPQHHLGLQPLHPQQERVGRAGAGPCRRVLGAGI